jgi:hypothetical protein
MSNKTLRGLAEAWLAACQYAALAQVDLSLEQFGACRLLDPHEIEELERYLEITRL